MKCKAWSCLVVAVTPLLIGPSAHAQFAVIDIAAINQLLLQVRALEQQVATAQAQLEQAQQEFEAITGSRGLQHLLEGVERNYLPVDWAALEAEMSGGGGALGSAFAGLLQAASILPEAIYSSLTERERLHVDALRKDAVRLQGISRSALAVTSERFAEIEQLIAAIGTATDQKAVLELQARIAAEQAMLQNDQSKLQALYQVATSEQWATAQRVQEHVAAGHGSFAHRFQPVP